MAFSHCFPRPGFLTLKVPAIAAVLAVSRPQAGNTVALLSAEVTGLVVGNGGAATVLESAGLGPLCLTFTTNFHKFYIYINLKHT